MTDEISSTVIEIRNGCSVHVCRNSCRRGQKSRVDWKRPIDRRKVYRVATNPEFDSSTWDKDNPPPMEVRQRTRRQ